MQSLDSVITKPMKFKESDKENNILLNIQKPAMAKKRYNQVGWYALMCI